MNLVKVNSFLLSISRDHFYLDITDPMIKFRVKKKYHNFTVTALTLINHYDEEDPVLPRISLWKIPSWCQKLHVKSDRVKLFNMKTKKLNDLENLQSFIAPNCNLLSSKKKPVVRLKLKRLTVGQLYQNVAAYTSMILRNPVDIESPVIIGDMERFECSICDVLVKLKNAKIINCYSTDNIEFESCVSLTTKDYISEPGKNIEHRRIVVHKIVQPIVGNYEILTLKFKFFSSITADFVNFDLPKLKLVRLVGWRNCSKELINYFKSFTEVELVGKGEPDPIEKIFKGIKEIARKIF